MISASAQGEQFVYHGLSYTILDPTDHTVDVARNREISGDLIIPAIVRHRGSEYSVTSIGSSAFQKCTGLTTIEIPNSVTYIGEYVFSECTGLTSVVIPNSVTSIQNGAFAWCSSLTSIVIPESVTEIGYYLFQGCTSLTEITCAEGNPSYSASQGVLLNKNQTVLIVCPEGKTGTYTIPNSVKSISKYAFQSCTGLSAIEIPNSVTYMGESVFSACTGLTSVMIPNSVTSIGNGAFRGCTSLTSVEIHGSVTYVGDNAFYGCTDLRSVYIPGSVTYIGTGAFDRCLSITTVYYDSAKPIEGDYFIFDNNTYSNSILYVPTAGLKKARAISPWSYFTNIEPHNFGGINDTTADSYPGALTEIYNLSGVKVATSVESLPAGIYIIRSNGKSHKITVR